MQKICFYYYFKEIHDCNIIVSEFKKNMSSTVDLQGVSENFSVHILSNLNSVKSIL